MTKQEQLCTILVAARLNGLIDYIPDNAELYRGYALFKNAECKHVAITDGKHIDTRFYTLGTVNLKIIIDTHNVSWDADPLSEYDSAKYRDIFGL